MSDVILRRHSGEDVQSVYADATPEERAVIDAGLRVEIRNERKHYRRSSAAAFAHDCIDWGPLGKPAPYQTEIWEQLEVEKRVAVRACHGAGKTAIAAIALLHYALQWDSEDQDWKIPTTASAWLQLTHFLWPEIHKWSRKVRWEEVGRDPLVAFRELMTLNLKLVNGEAFSASPSDATSIEGAHAERLLFVYDESKTIPSDIFDATEGAFAGAGADTTARAYALAISTPGEPVGRFYEIHARSPGTEDWWTRHVTIDEAIAAGRVSRDWTEARARQWGERSAIYQNRVLGEFATADEDGIIPLEWVEQANRRWLLRCLPDDYGKPDLATWEPPGPMDALGVDVARSGEDRTVLAPRYGESFGTLRYSSKEDTMATSGRVLGIMEANPGCKAIVDEIGIGAGVLDRLKETVKDSVRRVVAFVASAKSTKKDRSGELSYVNLRAEAYWALREMLDPAFGSVVELPPDDILTGDLVAPRYRVMSGAKIQVESKDDIRKRLGRSPDASDALAMAAWQGQPPPADLSAFDAMLR